MNEFADLVVKVGNSTGTLEKIRAITAYFQKASDKDKIWTIAIFTGRRPKRLVNTRQLTEWCKAMSGTPAWLFDECYHTVGDLAETIALLLPAPEHQHELAPSLSAVAASFIQLRQADENERKAYVLQCWKQMDKDTRFVFNKLITGGFRIGVSQRMMVNALEKITGKPSSQIAWQISGIWDPATISFEELLSGENILDDPSKPYPFYLAYQLNLSPGELGDPEDWNAEWKWDGIRGQVIHRKGQLFIWSRGEELITDKFPELHALADIIPSGTVLDGELVNIDLSRSTSSKIIPGPFANLQTRITRKTVSRKQLAEAPVGFIVYDLLEWQGEDIRNLSIKVRRSLLEQLDIINQHDHICLSESIAFNTWNELTILRSQSRENNSEGLMLKHWDSVYQVGRKSGDWWKWKIDPLTIDAVMIYAQKGHGRRSNLYTDYTFAVRDGDKLVTFAKAYSGLTDKEFAEVDAFVKRNSIEKFGPVRTVKPELVFEIAFEGIAASNRHKSGVAVRFPRISRWRKDKAANEINTLQDLKELLNTYGQ